MAQSSGDGPPGECRRIPESRPPRNPYLQGAQVSHLPDVRGHPHQPLKALKRSPLGVGGRTSADCYKVPAFELHIVGARRQVRDNSEQNMLARHID